ncbi:MAG: Uma2 family endonuclease [Synechococcaceae cyanobacterium]|nr:Uma2 family endonuclease [Synechococcaceae cyanobacterium]
MSLAAPPPRHPHTRHARFNVEQFHRLCEAVPEQRLEPIDGEVLEVIAKGTRHSAVVNRLTRLITLFLAARPDAALELRVESPLELGPDSEPEPDLALVSLLADTDLEAHPTAADTRLVIEVADSSLRFDLEAKASLYREAGIGHYWVVDVLKPRLIPVLEPASAESPLQELRGEVERLLAHIPPA